MAPLANWGACPCGCRAAQAFRSRHRAAPRRSDLPQPRRQRRKCRALGPRACPAAFPATAAATIRSAKGGTRRPAAAGTGEGGPASLQVSAEISTSWHVRSHRLHSAPMAFRIRSWASSGFPGYGPSSVRSIKLAHSARIASSYFAHASASSANTAGIAGAFSSARTVASTQILVFIFRSFFVDRGPEPLRGSLGCASRPPHIRPRPRRLE